MDRPISDVKRWVEADTKEALIKEIIWREQAATWLASRMYHALVGGDRSLDEVHSEQVSRHMGDPSAVPFTIFYEDGTTEELLINLTADCIRRELNM